MFRCLPKCLCTTLLLCPILLCAQTSRITLPIEKTSISVMPLVSDIKVVAHLADTSVLGFNVSDPENIVKLVSDTSVGEWLNDFVRHRYSDRLTAATRNRFIVKIQQLRLQLSGGNSWIKINSQLWFATELNDEYVQAGRLDTVLHVTDVTPGALIASVFDDLFASFDPAVQSNIAKNGSQLKSEEIVVYRRMLSGNSGRTAGAYRDFREFVQNKPSYTHIVAFPDSTDPNILRVYNVLPDSSKQEITAYWGLMMNNEVYVNGEYGLIPIEQHGNTMMISAFIDPAIRVNQAYFRRIVGKRTERPIFNALSVCSNYKAIATAVDPENGNLIF